MEEVILVNEQNAVLSQYALHSALPVLHHVPVINMNTETNAGEKKCLLDQNDNTSDLFSGAFWFKPQSEK
jgi:hypothetical protein